MTVRINEDSHLYEQEHLIRTLYKWGPIRTLAPYALAYRNNCPFLFGNTLLCRIHVPSTWEEEMVPVHPGALQASGSVGGRRRYLLTKRGTSHIVVATKPQDAPSQADGSGIMDVATWNICSGNNLGYQSALWAMKVYICLLTEAKLTDGIHAKF